ncbi:MAG: hypothetical protein ACREP9_12260 [Candidatus Dormibacteraceae bacterium]
MKGLVGLVMNFAGIVVPASCLTAAANTVYYGLFYTLIASQPTGTVSAYSLTQITLSIVRTLVACFSPVSTTISRLIAATQFALGVGPTAVSCLQVAQALFHAQALTPGDPNFLAGRAGVGNQEWVSGAEPLTYLVSFQNERNASAPAHPVVITSLLDPNLDPNTLQLSSITLVGVQIPITSALNPAVGSDELTTAVDLRPTQNLLVNVDAKLNPTTRSLIWTFTSIDRRPAGPRRMY